MIQRAMINKQARERGFTLAELMIALILLLITAGAIFQIVLSSTQHSTAEQAEQDMFHESREFMDQMSRDLHEAGYPSPRNGHSRVLTASPIANDTHAAVGLVKVAPGELWFEGDVDSSGSYATDSTRAP